MQPEVSLAHVLWMSKEGLTAVQGIHFLGAAATSPGREQTQTKVKTESLTEVQLSCCYFE